MNTYNLPVPVDGIESYLAQISHYPVLSREEERDLALRYYEQGDKEAASRLVLSNLRFVVKIAYEYKAYGFRMSDLIQEGNVGLLMAVKKFNPHKGYRLISYAVWWIKAYIQGYILRSWSLVRIGTTQAQRKLFYKLRRSKQKLLGGLEADLDRSLSEEEADRLAEQMALKGDEVLDMDSRLYFRDLSLNNPISTGGEGRDVTHQDLLTAPDNQEDIVIEQESSQLLSRQVHQAVQGLSEREHFIAVNRLMADEPMTLQEIGDHFGITRERARQIEERAKKKLRQVLQETT